MRKHPAHPLNKRRIGLKPDSTQPALPQGGAGCFLRGLGASCNASCFSRIGVHSGGRRRRLRGVDDSEPIIDLQSDAHFMGQALREAFKARSAGEVPVGAVVVHEGRVIARAWNQVETLKDATAHAEMLALTQAESALEDWRLTDCDLYVTKEPCPMCAGALVHCRVRRVIFGCVDPKGGAAGGFWNLLQAPNLNHRCEITAGVLAEESVALLKSFFAEARQRRADGQAHTKGMIFDGP